MDNISMRSTKPVHFSRNGNSGFQFDPKATEVAILDRNGRTIWEKRKGETPAPILWSGVDAQGQSVETGDYICKIVYTNDKIAYLPFVFVKKV